MSLKGTLPGKQGIEGTISPKQTITGKLSSLNTIHGYSAYEVAVINGFSGTEEEWLTSLKGKDGVDGVDGAPFTYDMFTPEQLEALRGEQGIPGEKGDPGERGLRGEQGVPGERGLPGEQGIQGEPGKAATVQIGSVTDGDNAQVTNSGTAQDAVLNFVLPRGEQGLPGTPGDPGTPGKDGTDGTAATVTVGTVTTLAPGEQATVVNSGTTSAAVLNFGIPQGASGSGTGDMLKSVYDKNNDGIIDRAAEADNAAKLNGKTDADFAPAVHNHQAAQVTFADGQTFQQKYDAGELRGQQGIQGIQGIPGEPGVAGSPGADGAPGAAATVTVGSVTQLAAGSTPTVTNSGTANAAVLNFGIPKGQDGQPGAAGADGKAATVTVGSVTTGAAGSSASVVNAGTANAAVLNFTIPRGADGQPGKDGGKGDPGYTPQKGVDYYTAADKQEIVSLVLANFTNVSEVGM